MTAAPKLGTSRKRAGNCGLGRKKGVPNKFTGELKEMVRQALDEAGGVEYLKTQATKSPTAFLTLVGKLLPAELNAKVDSQHTVSEEMLEWLNKRP
jgi:hypothetical protein